MDPEDRELLEHTLKLAEDNNRMLRRIHSMIRWGHVWGFLKILIFIVPLIVGYFYLEPYLGPVGKSIDQARALLQGTK